MKVACSCGALVLKTSLVRHLKTDKHRRLTLIKETTRIGRANFLRLKPSERQASSSSSLRPPLAGPLFPDEEVTLQDRFGGEEIARRNSLQETYLGEDVARRNSLREQCSSQATTLAVEVFVGQFFAFLCVPGVTSLKKITGKQAGRLAEFVLGT